MKIEQNPQLGGFVQFAYIGSVIIVVTILYLLTIHSMPNFIFSFKLTQVIKLFVVVLVATAGFLVTGVEKVEAVSWYSLIETCTGRPSERSCTTNAYFSMIVNSNKASYAVGENISLSTSAQSMFCNNFTADYSLFATLDGQTTTIVDHVFVAGGGSVHYSSGNITAPTTPGTYTINLNACNYADGTQCTTSSFDITVSAATATLSGTACEIPVGESTCQGTLTWSISNALYPNIYNWYEGFTVFPDQASGTSVPVTLTNGTNKLAARNGTDYIDAAWIEGVCELGGVWNGSLCAPAAPPTSPTGSVSGTACEIAAGERTCRGTLTWEITDAIDPNLYNAGGLTYSNNTSGNAELFDLVYGLNTVFVRDGVEPLGNVELLVACVSGSSWNGFICDTLPPPPPAPAINIAVDRELVRSGESVTSNIEVTAAYPATCTVYGVQNAPVVFAHSGTPATDTYSATTRTLTSSQIITVTCEAVPAIPGVADTTSETRVDVIPVMQEL